MGDAYDGSVHNAELWSGFVGDPKVVDKPRAQLTPAFGEEIKVTI
jgi:hypothetical protein